VVNASEITTRIGTARSTFSRGSRVPTTRPDATSPPTTTTSASSQSSGESSSTCLIAGVKVGRRTPSNQA
jgi:hypothetical protein